MLKVFPPVAAPLADAVILTAPALVIAILTAFMLPSGDAMVPGTVIVIGLAPKEYVDVPLEFGKKFVRVPSTNSPFAASVDGS
jgi:hypothetical protein